MMDIGQYQIGKQDGKYIVTEMLSGRVKEFDTRREMLDWIERDICETDNFD